jgi:hypothetical protein
VSPNAAAGSLLIAVIDRWRHATAVVAELASQKEWAIDSWTHAAGERPDIMPLEQWRNDNSPTGATHLNMRGINCKANMADRLLFVAV